MTAPRLRPTPEEIAYVEARCNEIRAILRRPVQETRTELAELQRIIGVSAKPQSEPVEIEAEQAQWE